LQALLSPGARMLGRVLVIVNRISFTSITHWQLVLLCSALFIKGPWDMFVR